MEIRSKTGEIIKTVVWRNGRWEDKPVKLKEKLICTICDNNILEDEIRYSKSGGIICPDCAADDEEEEN